MGNRGEGREKRGGVSLKIFIIRCERIDVKTEKISEELGDFTHES